MSDTDTNVRDNCWSRCTEKYWMSNHAIQDIFMYFAYQMLQQRVSATTEVDCIYNNAFQLFLHQIYFVHSISCLLYLLSVPYSYRGFSFWKYTRRLNLILIDCLSKPFRSRKWRGQCTYMYITYKWSILTSVFLKQKKMSQIK